MRVVIMISEEEESQHFFREVLCVHTKPQSLSKGVPPMEIFGVVCISDLSPFEDRFLFAQHEGSFVLVQLSPEIRHVPTFKPSIHFVPSEA